MKKEIIQVNDKLGTVRVTTIEERWYAREGLDPITGLPTIDWRPSMSWISSKYPKGIGYFRWLADNGWDEAEAIKKERGQSGSKVHQACDLIAKGVDVNFNDKFTNTENGLLEELTVDEYEKVLNYRQWWDSIASRHPRIIASEITIWADTYAGTVDQIIELDNEDDASKREVIIIDIKTSQDIFDAHEIQVDGYFHAPIVFSPDTDPELFIHVKPTQMAILQLGYRRNKLKYRFTLLEGATDKRDIAYRIWKLDHGAEAPKQRDLPLVIKGISVPEVPPVSTPIPPKLEAPASPTLFSDKPAQAEPPVKPKGRSQTKKNQ